MNKSLIIACDGEAASGKSTGARLLSKKYKLLLLNSGLLYRYASKILITKKPKKPIPYLKKIFKKVSYNLIKKQPLHSQEISNHVGYLAKNKAVREIMKLYQKRIIKKNKRICVEGRDIATKILNKNPKYDLAFYFTCKINIAAIRRWKELKKKVPLKEVQKSLTKRTKMDKSRKHSPLKKAKDAILIRTEKISKKEVLRKMSNEVDKII
jgi:cytidylate kinase